MPQTRIDSAVASDLTNAMTDYSVATQSTDAASEQKETRWMNREWTQYLGYYKTIPELRAAIDAKATWTVGKGFVADSETTTILNHVHGFGKDTFNTILENMIRTMQVGGDAYAEIILDDDGDLLNLKPLDPEVMVNIAGRNGMITNFEQVSKVKGNPNKKFKPEEIFYLPRNRIADEIHGVSLIESIKDIILMRNEAMDDWKRVLHRNVDPLWIFHMDTDDTTEIAAFKTKQDNARGKGENMYVPKDVIVPEVVTTAGNATLNPLPWIENLNNYFFQATGVPQIIVGGSNEFTEATAKIAYLTFQQTIEEEQLFIQEQVEEQLGYTIELEFPATIENDLISDNEKDGAENIQPNEVQVNTEEEDGTQPTEKTET